MTLKGDAKLTHSLKNDIRNLVNIHASSRKSENLHFDELFLTKAHKDLDEKVQKSYVSWHWRVMQSLKKNWLLVPKMTWGIWWIFIQQRKSDNFHFDVLLFSIAYNVSDKKVRKNYLSWHWRLIQTLKKNWLFVWEMTWRIRAILTRAVESLRICSLMGCFCRKHVMFELKKYRGVVSSKMTYGFKNDIRNLENFHTSSWN